MMLPCTNLAGFMGESSGILGLDGSSDGTGMSAYTASSRDKEPVPEVLCWEGFLSARKERERGRKKEVFRECKGFVNAWCGTVRSDNTRA